MAIKFYELRTIIPANTWIYLKNENRARLETELNETLIDRYDDCNVIEVGSADGDAITVLVEAYKRVTATFTTEVDGYSIEKEVEYNAFDYDDDDDLAYAIDEAFDEWKDELKGEIDSYADKEVEGM